MLLLAFVLVMACSSSDCDDCFPPFSVAVGGLKPRTRRGFDPRIHSMLCDSCGDSDGDGDGDEEQSLPERRDKRGSYDRSGGKGTQAKWGGAKT